MARKHALILAVAILILFTSCVMSAQVMTQPMPGFNFYTNTQLNNRYGTSYIVGNNISGVNVTVRKYFEKKMSDYYIGTGYGDAISVTSPQVRFYTASSGGEEIPGDSYIHDGMYIYVGVAR